MCEFIFRVLIGFRYEFRLHAKYKKRNVYDFVRFSRNVTLQERQPLPFPAMLAGSGRYDDPYNGCPQTGGN
jgi:hypothetical protein